MSIPHILNVFGAAIAFASAAYQMRFYLKYFGMIRIAIEYQADKDFIGQLHDHQKMFLKFALLGIGIGIFNLWLLVRFP